MEKCYGKEFGHQIPKVYCRFCKRHIKPGENVYIILLTQKDARSSCKQCYNKFVVDKSFDVEEIS